MGHNAIDPEIAACDALSLQATQAGAQTFARLLTLAEERDSGQIPRIARFLAATYNGQAFQFDLFELRRRRDHQQRHVAAWTRRAGAAPTCTR
jgi:hypothetical protein